jgi:hypothetical protein
LLDSCTWAARKAPVGALTATPTAK